jgi:tRNA(fMet)-specific endonuclease VapC
MRRYVLDTGIASDYVNRRHGVYEQARVAVERGDRIGIGTPALGELWAGVQASTTRDRNIKLLKRQVADMTIWPFDTAAAEKFGELFAELRRLGRPMQQIDMQVAAIAMSLGNSSVVSKDSDFAAIPGLDVVDWSKSRETSP